MHVHVRMCACAPFVTDQPPWTAVVATASSHPGAPQRPLLWPGRPVAHHTHTHHTHTHTHTHTLTLYNRTTGAVRVLLYTFVWSRRNRGRVCGVVRVCVCVSVCEPVMCCVCSVCMWVWCVGCVHGITHPQMSR